MKLKSTQITGSLEKVRDETLRLVQEGWDWNGRIETYNDLGVSATFLTKYETTAEGDE